ncbi:leucine-rich repeat-containing protein 3B [Thalassophryne amazonica]|uniref:leucine-rich repeat-containing protein 3B n=1 Tax=Thalassophryne amazonica TaxID=390379 RepID=UPI0014710E18|nr:leucine-rich repeat-containing protein 3B [Thalassophryne amazonica]XP_034049863.1 leucine-rich repeat-containing protein 3B [Thalassophryne amazonica]XP_034049865.1 leucine-rich repeat-containing protein 3B [Thalassophryne amazonica]XP_034049866.1 leucine-rich repeat-containing protein 3B [Thalassophryne amazonica]
MPLLTDWLLRHSVVMCLLLHSLVLMTFCFHNAATSCSKSCYCSESEGDGKTVRCSNLQLTEIPQDIPNDTRRAYLDFNLFTTVPANAFAGLPHLVELDLSHNELSQLEPGAFRGLGSSLKFLDLSSNKLVNFNPEAFEGLRCHTNLTNNLWHCDCNLQMAMPHVDLEPTSLAGIVCQTSDPKEIGVEGLAFLLTPDIDLCVVRTTDVALLVVMFGWFTMVISYLVYYVRVNQEDARRHLEYLKSLPSRQSKLEESSTISTVV